MRKVDGNDIYTLFGMMFGIKAIAIVILTSH